MIFGNTTLNLDVPRVMGILNVTPDSFSDGGKHNSLDNAMRQADAMVKAGATIIDVGGESTRPGAPEVTLDEELERVIPVIEKMASELETIISIDTSKSGVMRAAVEAGASLINDVQALQAPGALDAAVACGVPVCLMHMQGLPRTMQHNPQYSDVAQEVCDFLMSRANACIDAGIRKEQIILDPGFGFGKTLDHNFALFAQLNKVQSLGFPVLVGVSRKSMIGNLLDRSTDERLAGSLALAALASYQNANILRVHDVTETVDVVKIINKVQQFLQ